MILNGYTIISISDDRLEYKEVIRSRMGWLKDLNIIAVDAQNESLSDLIKHYQIKSIWPSAKRGEVGVWFSMLEVCSHCVENNETVLAIEDDAFVNPDVQNLLTIAIDQLPDDCDVFAVTVPQNQKVLGNIEWINKDVGLGVTHSELAPSFRIPGATSVCKAYQGYCFVSMVYTPTGAQKVLELAKNGFTGPADCWLFEMHEAGKLNVCTLVPDHPDIITVDWDNQAPTTVHDTPLAMI